MKTLQTILLACLLVGVAAAARAPSPFIAAAAATVTALAPVQSPPPDDYTVDLAVTQGVGTTTWTYTITRPFTTAKEFPHFTIDFGNCGPESPTVADITSATVNGVD